MGIFYQSKLHPEVEEAVRRASTGTRRGEGDPEADMARLALVHELTREQEIQWPRLLIALGLVAALAVGGVICEAFDLDSSTDAFWGLATAAFGIIVGLLGGEKASAYGGAGPSAVSGSPYQQ